ncbi:unnamed protein product [Choristocarpus tenellus]
MPLLSKPLGRPVAAFVAPFSSISCLGQSARELSYLPSAPYSPIKRASPLSTFPPGSAHRFLSHRAMSTASGNDSSVAAVSLIQANLEAVRQCVANVTTEVDNGGPAPRLVAVSKTKPLGDLIAAYEAGQRIFGENYAQELIEKAPAMPADVLWHFIGHLQSNKARALLEGVPNLSVLETLDSIKLANKLQACTCESIGRSIPLGVYIQVDSSGEASKSGVGHEDLDAILALARHLREKCPMLELRGIMTIGAPGDLDCFDRLAACRALVAAGLEVEEGSLELSMGMSGDFEEAIRKGSTNVRVGSTIFGARYYPEKS